MFQVIVENKVVKIFDAHHEALLFAVTIADQLPRIHERCIWIPSEFDDYNV